MDFEYYDSSDKRCQLNDSTLAAQRLVEVVGLGAMTHHTVGSIAFIVERLLMAMRSRTSSAGTVSLDQSHDQQECWTSLY